MGEALRKQEKRPMEDTANTPVGGITDLEAPSEAIPVGSPAKALQDKLDRHFSVRRTKFSAQFITWLVIGACVGTWLSGIGLYATL